VITGIGIDLIEIDRVVKACQNESFLKKFFTQPEIELVKSDLKKAADNFAVKEAVAKMLGTGFRGFLPIDIEVLRNPEGKPYVQLFGTAAELAKQQGVTRIQVSISNTKELSNAIAIGEK